MSGYLQRLGISASRPAQRLRPWLGSIFSGERHEESAAGGIEEVTQESPGPAPTEDSGPDSPASHAKPVEHVAQPAPPRGKNAPEATGGRPERSHFQPLLPDLREKPAASDTISPETAAQTFTGQHTRSVVESEARLSAASLPGDATSTDREATESDRGTGSHDQSPAREANTLSPVMTARKRMYDTTPARREPTRSEPEDIQIHIGRIEVIAAPPPAARAPAAPTSRSTKLEDYLNSRGRGRIR